MRVVPGGGGQGGVRLGRVDGVRWVRGVGAVEVGVEGEGVVRVALQGTQAVMMGVAQGFGDGVGQQRVRTDLDERGVLGGRGCDGIAEPHRVAQICDPVLGIEHWAAGRDRRGRADQGDRRRAGHQIV